MTNEQWFKIIAITISAILGTGFVFKFVVNRNKNKSANTINIKKSKINGDVAGRDIKK